MRLIYISHRKVLLPNFYQFLENTRRLHCTSKYIFTKILRDTIQEGVTKSNLIDLLNSPLGVNLSLCSGNKHLVYSKIINYAFRSRYSHALKHAVTVMKIHFPVIRFLPLPPTKSQQPMWLFLLWRQSEMLKLPADSLARLRS